MITKNLILSSILLLHFLHAADIQIEQTGSGLSVKSHMDAGYFYVLKSSDDLEEWQQSGSYIDGDDETVSIPITTSKSQEFFKFERIERVSPLTIDSRLIPEIEEALIPYATDSDWIRLSLDANGSFEAPGILEGNILSFTGTWQWASSEENPNQMLFKITIAQVDIDGEVQTIENAAAALNQTFPTSLLASIDYISASDVSIRTELQTTDSLTPVLGLEDISLERETIYLILAMGQSNMVAINAPEDILYPELDSEILLNISAGTDLDATEGTILETQSETNGAWMTSADIQSAYGLERSFARSLANKGNTVAIAKWARNGKDIARWNNQQNSSNYYIIWTKWYHKRVAELRMMGYTVHPIFLWSQGSADCKWNRGASYQSALTELINTVRLLSRNDSMPVVIGRTYKGIQHPDIATDFSLEDYTEVRLAQESIGGEANNIWYDRDSMLFRDGHTHFYSTEYQREGSDLAFISYWNKFSAY